MAFGGGAKDESKEKLSPAEMIEFSLYVFRQKGKAAGRDIVSLMSRVVAKGNSILVVDETFCSGLLHFAAVEIKDTDQFIRFLEFFIEQGGDVNLVNHQGYTALDMCRNFAGSIPDADRRGRCLESYGGKLGRTVSEIQEQLAAESILPGYEAGGSGLAFSSYRGFSFEDSALQPVEAWLAHPVKNITYADTVPVGPVLAAAKPAIGRLFDDDECVSTVFLIKDNWIITARHSVNFRELADLKVVFAEAKADEGIALAGVIESGASFGLDYIVLQLATSVAIPPLSLTDDNASSSLLFVGYDADSTLQFSAFPNANPGQLSIIGYQQTGVTLSGSPYLDLDGTVCGLHSRASANAKTGLYIRMVTETKLDSVLAQLIAGVDLSEIPVHSEVECFEEFTGAKAEFGEFDEGGQPLKISVRMVEGVPHFDGEGRPSNQNVQKVQAKIETRLERLQAAGKVLTEVQACFLDRVDYKLAPHEIDVAHNIAIGVLRDGVVAKMNTPTVVAADAQEMKAVNDFADAIASSDDEAKPVAKTSGVKQKLPRLIRNIRQKQRQAEGMTQAEAKVLAREAEEILKILNRRSKNLMPGHASVNRSIGEARDPHLVKVGAQYQETAIAKRLAETATAFLEKAYEPKKRGENAVQSSSVDSDNKPAQAYTIPLP